MKKINVLVRKTGGTLACMALLVAQLSMTQACFVLFHQPKVPDSIKNLKR